MADGPFERFPVDVIFSAHNIPGMHADTFATRAGGIMASDDNFVIHIKWHARGAPAHGRRPHRHRLANRARLAG
ncbi:hypothetical protein PSAC2689_110224 [Paraburkholderia sacchari]